MRERTWCNIVQCVTNARTCDDAAAAVGGMSAKGGGGGGGEAGGGDVVLAGYLKKLKTMKRKWFVLRAESSEASARLEYYDNRKKELQRQPKRSIPLRACFNINRRLDTKHKHVIALYTKDDCFCVVLESERDLDAWLKALLSLQRGDDVPDGEPPRPHFGMYPLRHVPNT